MPQLQALCEKYKVVRLYAFGSVLTDHFHPRWSDVDLQVVLEPMPPMERGGTLNQLWSELQDLFGRQVDMLSDQPIENPYFKEELDSTKQLIYEQKSEDLLV